MKRALLLLALLAGGCGGDKAPVANQAEPASSETVAPPIDNRAGNSIEPGESVSRSVAVPSKPLVSRETSAHPKPSPGDRAPDYRAIGTEPFWAVTMRGSTATLERPGTASLRFVITDKDSDDTAIRYTGDGFTMTLTQGPCSDGMSDAVWSDRVAIAFGEGTLKGCGGTRDNGAGPVY
ncbi:membrane-like protein [Sphingobium sp. HBC34]|uniref:Membrane-like protein n=1 Tax=Sphingobium cyanobacteriorum TaxID=3063954 RepID=A0ABT8ZMU5_9SPHN|nr:membrane-like protein [Sphingobium sp. HBC34]MDO7835850.1 membrane-like protein [Sphingobium sp. HBC34]